MTIVNTELAAALDIAQRIKQQPELLIDHRATHATIKALAAALNASTCYKNAQLKGREVFVLQSSDRLAPGVIREWAMVAKDYGCPQAKVDDAYKVASRWQALPASETKYPD